MKLARLCAVFFAALFLVILASFAVPLEAWAAVAPAPNTQVQIIPAQYFDEATLIAVATAIAGTANSILVKLMGPWGWAAKLARVDQLFFKYIKGGLVKLVQQHPELVTKGVTIDVGNSYIAGVARDLVQVIPAWMLRFIGGREKIEDMIRNRLPEALRDIDLPLDVLTKSAAK